MRSILDRLYSEEMAMLPMWLQNAKRNADETYTDDTARGEKVYIANRREKTFDG